jgi:hypothetical protein
MRLSHEHQHGGSHLHERLVARLSVLLGLLDALERVLEACGGAVGVTELAFGLGQVDQRDQSHLKEEEDVCAAIHRRT